MSISKKLLIPVIFSSIATLSLVRSEYREKNILQKEITKVETQNQMLKQQLIKLICVTDAHTGNIINRIDDLEAQIIERQHESATALHWDLRGFKINESPMLQADKEVLEKRISKNDKYFLRKPE